MEDVAIRCSGPDMRRTCEVDCGDGFFKLKSSCQPCPLDCRTCTSMDTCLSCNEMRFLHGMYDNISVYKINTMKRVL